MKTKTEGLTEPQARALRELAEPGIQPRSVFTGWRLEKLGLVTSKSALVSSRTDRFGDTLDTYQPFFTLTPKGWEHLGIKQERKKKSC